MYYTLLMLINLMLCIVNGMQAAYYFGMMDDVGRSLPYFGWSFFNLVVYVWIKNRLLTKKDGG